MKNYLHHQLRHAQGNCQKFAFRLEKGLKEGQLTGKKLYLLSQRLRKWQSKLQSLQSKFKLAGTGLAMGAILLGNSTTVVAQTKTPVFASVSNNPFGFTDIGDNSSASFVDLDGDGDLDAFVGEENGNIKYFENTGNSNVPAFAAVSDNPFGFTDIGDDSSPSFVDLDNDGDLDAFIGERNGNIKYFENTGNHNSPTFASVVNNPFGFADTGSMSKPEFADLDGDGDLDAFVGHNFGRVRYFENTGNSNTPTFGTPSDNPFGLSDIGGAAKPAFADLDGDGDLDAFVGENGGNIKYFENTGNSNTPTFASVSNNPFGFTDIGSHSIPDFADLDGDGDLDTFVGESTGNIKYFENTGTVATFSFATISNNPFGLTDVGRFSTPSFADLDNDGDLDAFIGEKDGNIKYFENTGNNNVPAFASVVNNPFGFTKVGDGAKPAFADLDGDGDLDAFVGDVFGDLKYFQNTGNSNTPTFASVAVNPFGFIDVGNHFAPCFVDLDGDGDLDAVVGEELYNFNYFENTGNSTAPAFGTASSNPFGLKATEIYSSLSFADLDNDGDLDAFVGDASSRIKYFENTGNSTFPTFATTSGNPFGFIYRDGSIDFADLDGDGDLDAFVGNFFGDIAYFRNVTLFVWDGVSWSPSSPTTTDDATINGDYATDGDGDISTKDLKVNATFTLTIADGDKVEIAEDLINSGSILVESGGSLVQTISSPSNSGTGSYSVSRTVSDYVDQFHYWASPLQSITMGDGFPSSVSKNFYSFDASTQAWVSENTSTTMNAGMGYIAAGQSNPLTDVTYTFSNTSGFNSGTITITPEFDGTAGVSTTNWNLIGNPYPSGLDATQFLTDNNAVLESAVYLWSSDGDDVGGLSSDYATMNSLGVVNAGGSGVAPSSATIASTQGFFVQTLASGNIAFDNSQRISTNNTFQRTTSLGQRIWLTAQLENGAQNEILLGFLDDASIEKDRYDAAKLSGNSQLSFYSLMEEQPLTIQSLPTFTDQQIVPLGIEAKTAGRFTFQISKLDSFDESVGIYLYDALTKTQIDLRSQAYSVELATGIYEDRFTLKLLPNQVTSLADEVISTGINAYAYQKQISIRFDRTAAAQAEIAIYNLQGQLLLKTNNETKLERNFQMKETGIYIVRVMNRYGTINQKLLVK